MNPEITLHEHDDHVVVILKDRDGSIWDLCTISRKGIMLYHGIISKDIRTDDQGRVHVIKEFDA